MKRSQFWAELLAEFGGNPWTAYRKTGLLVPIGGGDIRPVNPAEGYNETADIPLRTVDGVPLEDLWNEFNEVLRLVNAQRNPLIERLTFPVGRPFEQIMQGIAADFEPADEFAQPVGIRLPRPWNLGFSLDYFDLAQRFTWRFLGRSTAAQLRALNNEALDADNRLIYRTVFNRVFRNITDSATLEDTGTVVSVFPFYNGDVTALPVAPPSWKSYNHTTTHTHYLTSGGATVDSGDLDQMEDHLYHHGYVEGGTLILLVNRAQANTIRKFRVTAGDRYDFIPAAGDPAATFLGTLVGALPGAPRGELGGLDTFIGTYGRWNIVEEDMIPSGYMFGFASGGTRAERNPIGIREHDNASLRGLKLIPQFDRYPLRESFYHHSIGSGVRHLGAGVVMQITASPTYVIPAVLYGGAGGR